MSKTSMKERNKAVRKAWEREQQLVKEGCGTRDWTEEQQKDILDPAKGKAYDDQGRAFEGQHMKSAVEYPEYQANPENIQFLTKDEHLEAHKGSWQNPTNWYYDPVMKEYIDFGDGNIIPCEVIQLSNPVVVINRLEPVEAVKETGAENNPEPVKNKGQPKNNNTVSVKEKKAVYEATVAYKVSKSDIKFVKELKAVGKFIVDHPVELLEITGIVDAVTRKIISSVVASRNNSGTQGTTQSTSSGKADMISKTADSVEQSNRAMPSENDVPGHKQRYHTKKRVVWKDKPPYHRGGKE